MKYLQSKQKKLGGAAAMDNEENIKEIYGEEAEEADREAMKRWERRLTRAEERGTRF